MEEVHPHRVALGNAFLSPMERKNKCKVYLDLGERDQWEVPGGLQSVTRTEPWRGLIDSAGGSDKRSNVQPEKCPNSSD